MGILSRGGGGSKVGDGYVKIKPDATGFGDELESSVGKEANNRAGLMGSKASAAFAGAFAAGAATIGKGVFDFADFDAGMREVFTLMPDITDKAMADMTGQVKDFASEFGVLPNDVIPALYNSISAGVPADNVFSFIETAQQLAKGGVTDLNTAVDGLSSVVNAYGEDVISAEQASDLMFTAVKGGKTTVDELAGSLFNVTPTASALGVEFGNVTAALATMTAAGTPTSVATTQLRQLLVELSKDGSKAAAVFEDMAGESFSEFIEGGGNLQNALNIMDDAAVESGKSLADMFGSVEAGSAALSLTGANSEKFFNELQAGQDAAGATTEAFETMNTGLSATMDRLRARFAVALVNLGESLAPSIEQIGNAVAGLVEVFTKLPAPMQTGIILFATLTAGALAFAGPMLKVIKLGGQMSKMFSVLAANPWVLVALAIVAAGVLIYKNWDTIVEKLGAAWDWIVDATEEVADFFTDTWTATTGWVVDAWEDMTGAITEFAGEIWSAVTETFGAIADFFLEWWPYILGVFTGGIGLVVGLVIQNWDAIWSKTQEVTGAIVGFFTTAWNSVWSTVQSVGGQVVGFITGIPTTIAGAFTTLAETITAPFRTAFNSIKSLWNSTVGGFGFSVPGWIPGVGGNSFNIPSMANGGVLTAPTLFLGGEYLNANRDPEIVSPRSMMRDTVVEALGQAGGGSGLTVETVLHVDAGVDEARFARMLETASTEIVRVVQRELDRQRTAKGQPSGAVAA